MKVEDKIRESQCEVCGKPAKGTGSGIFYCEFHFWQAFDDMEQKADGEHE